MIPVRAALGALALAGCLIALAVIGPRTPRPAPAPGRSRDTRGASPSDETGYGDGTSMGDVPHLPAFAARFRYGSR
jgi:hypothetical protein